MTLVEFRRIKRSAAAKWKRGVAHKDLFEAVTWWDLEGRKRCAFCYNFGCSRCPLSRGANLIPEWNWCDERYTKQSLHHISPPIEPTKLTLKQQATSFKALMKRFNTILRKIEKVEWQEEFNAIEYRGLDGKR